MGKRLEKKRVVNIRVRHPCVVMEDGTRVLGKGAWNNLLKRSSNHHPGKFWREACWLSWMILKVI
ncbi:MAG: hypothetical protein ACLUPL_01990 [Butyricimonas virosa]